MKGDNIMIDDRCKAIKTNGVPCKARRLDGSDFCYAHDPATRKRIRREAYELYCKTQIQREAEMLQWKTKIGQDVLSLKQERFQLQREVGELQFKYNEMKKFIEDLANIARLEEIYQVAKETKDAATMNSVNKSMYYAIRNAKRKETTQWTI